MRALAPAMGISVPSLFGYRSGKIPISAKAWSKLERFESPPKPPAISDDDPAMGREDETSYRFTPMGQQCQGHDPPMEELMTVLLRIANALERLIEIEESRTPKP